MRRLIFMFLYLSAITKGYSQNAVLSADKMNVVFIGVDNPISVALSGYSEKQINIVSNYGSLEGKNGKYIFRISFVPAEPLRFTVYVLKNKKKTAIHSFVYRVKRIPDPVVRIPCSHKNISQCIDNIVENGLSVELENFDFDVSLHVHSFEFSIIKKDSSVSLHHNNGSQLEPGNKTLFKNLLPGEKIEILNVITTGPDDFFATTRKTILIR